MTRVSATTVHLKLGFLTLLAIFVFVFLGQAALAKTQSPTRPGWGIGDQNHVHLGPPGQSVVVSNNITQSSNQVTNTEINLNSSTGEINVSGNSGPTTVVTGDSSSSISVVTTNGINRVNP